MMRKHRIYLGVLLAVLLTATACSGKKPAAETPVASSIEETQQLEETETETPSTEEATFEIALVTDERTLEVGMENKTAWSGLEHYAEEQGLSHCYYRPASNGQTDYQNAVTDAIEKGAGLIICAGDQAEKIVLGMQEEYKKVQFLILNAEGHRTVDLGLNVREVRMQVEQGGYMAGYLAGKSGYHTVACMYDSSTPDSVRYYYGYLQGLSAAGEEAETITVYSMPFQKNTASEKILEKMNEWKEAGVELVFGAGEAFADSIANAAQTISMDSIVTEKSLSEINESVLMAVQLDYSKCVEDACAAYFEKSYQGGKQYWYDMSTDSVSLEVRDGRLSGYSEEMSSQLYEDLSDGEIQMNNDITIPARSLELPGIDLHEAK